MRRTIVLFTCLIAALCSPGRGSIVAGAYAEGPRPAANSYSATPPGLKAPTKDIGKGMFLIASEKLRDPNFSKSVVLLLEYDASGALGLIINRPSDVALSSALPEVEGLADRKDVLYIGGPVGRNQLFLLIRGPSRPTDARPVIDGIYSSVSIETLRAVITSKTVEFHAHAGYAGWGPGQLDAEVMRGDWYLSPGDAVTLFDQSSDEVWPALIKKNAGLWVRRTMDRTHQLASACPRHTGPGQPGPTPCRFDEFIVHQSFSR